MERERIGKPPAEHSVKILRQVWEARQEEEARREEALRRERAARREEALRRERAAHQEEGQIRDPDAVPVDIPAPVVGSPPFHRSMTHQDIRRRFEEIASQPRPPLHHVDTQPRGSPSPVITQQVIIPSSGGGMPTSTIFMWTLILKFIMALFFCQYYRAPIFVGSMVIYGIMTIMECLSIFMLGYVPPPSSQRMRKLMINGFYILFILGHGIFNVLTSAVVTNAFPSYTQEMDEIKPMFLALSIIFIIIAYWSATDFITNPSFVSDHASIYLSMLVATTRLDIAIFELFIGHTVFYQYPIFDVISLAISLIDPIITFVRDFKTSD